METKPGIKGTAAAELLWFQVKGLQTPTWFFKVHPQSEGCTYSN